MPDVKLPKKKRVENQEPEDGGFVSDVKKHLSRVASAMMPSYGQGSEDSRAELTDAERKEKWKKKYENY